jgi:hypothetical protein
MNLDRALVFALLLTGACSARSPEIARSPAPSPPPAPVVSTTPASPAPPPAAQRECPAVDLAALEPPPPARDPRVVDLGEVFPRDEVRVPGAATRSIDLGRERYSLHPGGGDPGFSVGVGLGFPALDADWVKGDVSPPLAAALDVWTTAGGAWMAQGRGALLLGERASVLRAVPPGDDGFALRCVTEARARALDLERVHDAAARDAAAQILALLEAHPPKNAAETLLLGCLLTDRTAPPRGEPASAKARSIQLLSRVASDVKAHRKLRAIAAEQVARLLDGAAQIAALRRVIALTDDPEQRIETLIKLADLAPGKRAELEKQLEQILVELARRPPSYRAAFTLAKLAKSRLDRGAFALARDAAAQCARETANDTFDTPDPWDCAPVLATALGELGGAARGAEVPLPFLGPLGLQIMREAKGRLDRDEARRAGELLVARLPMATEAPEALDLLISLSSDPQAKRSLLERRERDYGPGSGWLAAQRARLAVRNELPELERALTRLVQPTTELGSPPPTTEEQSRAELGQRLDQVIQGCEGELAASGREIALRIDTTGSLPRVTASGANVRLAACLTGVAVTRFRSVGPAKISVILSGE